MYFKDFPYLEYDFPDGQTRFIKNITIRPSIVDEVFGDSRNLQDYMISDGETPETIAYNVYGDAQMHWVIMLSNNINSIYADWPKSTPELYDFIKNKYQVQTDSDGNTVTLYGEDLEEFVEFKGSPANNYASTNSSNVVLKPVHFKDDEGTVYSYDTVVNATNIDAFGRTVLLPAVVPVSIYEFEDEINENKRLLKIPTAGLARKIVSELGNLLDE